MIDLQGLGFEVGVRDVKDDLGLILPSLGDIWNISQVWGGGGGGYVNFWISRMSRGWIWGGFCPFCGENRKSSQGGGGGGGVRELFAVE